MRLFLDASKDAFITNKTVNNSLTASDANTGRAGTIEVFKLYGESTYPTTCSIELSRGLIKFDMDSVRALTSSILNLNYATFFLKMFDAKHSDTVPSDFNLIAFPISCSWTEGVGLDTKKFKDTGAVNWLSSSEGTYWDASGATGSSDILSSYYATQSFSIGTEDLSVNVTTICSMSLTNQIPDEGFLISLSGSEETDAETRYKKSFFSRHSAFFNTRPRLEVYYDDSIQDHRKNFIFDKDRSLYLYNIIDGEFADIFSGTTELSGLHDIEVKILQTGTSDVHAKYTTTEFATRIRSGVYSATFNLDSTNQDLTHSAYFDKSASFNDFWKFPTSDLCFHTGTFNVIPSEKIEYKPRKKNYKISIGNFRSEYDYDQEVLFRVYIENFSPQFRRSRSVIEPEDEDQIVFDNMHWQIRDYNTGDIIIGFDTTYNSTKLSYDSQGMYFTFYMDTLAVGGLYSIEFMIIEADTERFFDDRFIFKVIE